MNGIHSDRLAFTLIEVVIVVTVIALILGGVLAGRHLIRIADMQSVIADVNGYKNAAKLFRDKYKYLPGDLPVATEYWGAYSGCPSPPASTERTVRTCNGDGNGFIGSNAGSPLLMGDIGTAAASEPLRVWQHLSNAGFINGQYSGTRSPGPTASQFGLDVGLNLPASSIDGGGFTFHYARPVAPGAMLGVFGARYGHVIVFGRTEPICSPQPCFMPPEEPYPARWPAIPASEAFTIDQKMDDGRPGTGAVLSYTPSATACANSANEGTAMYRSEDGQVACSLIFRTGL